MVSAVEEKMLLFYNSKMGMTNDSAVNDRESGPGEDEGLNGIS